MTSAFQGEMRPLTAKLPSRSSVLIGVTIAVPCRGCLSGKWQFVRFCMFLSEVEEMKCQGYSGSVSSCSVVVIYYIYYTSMVLWYALMILFSSCGVLLL